MMKITKLEMQLLQGIKADNSFWGETENFEGGVWAFHNSTVWQATGGKVEQLSGVIASLIKKGLANIWDNAGEKYFEFTDLGLALIRSVEVAEVAEVAPEVVAEVEVTDKKTIDAGRKLFNAFRESIR
jgi:NAD(P)H-hydrate repair Nnr-like enzyme with NAD(P)H-hydrate dehydratase domain